MEYFFAATFLLWYTFIYVMMVRSGQGAFRFVTSIPGALLLAVYIPFLALGPATSAYFADIRSRIRDTF